MAKILKYCCKKRDKEIKNKYSNLKSPPSQTFRIDEIFQLPNGDVDSETMNEFERLKKIHGFQSDLSEFAKIEMTRGHTLCELVLSVESKYSPVLVNMKKYQDNKKERLPVVQQSSYELDPDQVHRPPVSTPDSVDPVTVTSMSIYTISNYTKQSKCI